MVWPAGSTVTSDDGAGGSSTYTNPAAPRPVYPRNRVAAQWRPTAGATTDRRSVAVSDGGGGLPGPRRPGGRDVPVYNPWTDPGPGRNWGGFASADPAQDMPLAWSREINHPRTPDYYPPPAEMKAAGFDPRRLTPYGQPGPSKYNVKYDAWGNKVQESFDAGNMGKNGQPLRYDENGNTNPNWYEDLSKQLGGRPFVTTTGGGSPQYDNFNLPYSVAGFGRPRPSWGPTPMIGPQPGDPGYGGNKMGYTDDFRRYNGETNWSDYGMSDPREVMRFKDQASYDNYQPQPQVYMPKPQVDEFGYPMESFQPVDRGLTPWDMPTYGGGFTPSWGGSSGGK